MNDLLERLQVPLGDTYRLEREFEGGGMSRLFLATELASGRRVVVKLLPPELVSEVAAARFKREIELTKHLVHPHILPILSAGAEDGLLFYVMPYLSGESLRDRLINGGPLPVDEAVAMLRKISDAVAYAHSHGIVHRDIKPENILLEGGQPVLADFGIARALEAAQAGAAAKGQALADPSRRTIYEKLTATGVALGTPGYIAPEQLFGTAPVDARVDVYALAVVGYEMMAGSMPFGGDTPQELLTASLTQEVRPLQVVCDRAPAAVCIAIERGLARDPEKRWPTAAEFRDALDASVGRWRAAWRRARHSRVAQASAGAAVLALAVAAGSAVMRARAVRGLEPNLVAVAPFAVYDADLAMWKEGLVDVIARNLDGAAPVRAVPPDAVLRRWGGAGAATPATAATLARNARAGLAVVGKLRRSGGADSLALSASLIDAADGGALGREVVVRGAAAQLDRMSDSVSVLLLNEIARVRKLTGVRSLALGIAPLPVLKPFLQGEQFYRRAEWDSAMVYYDRALAADSNFALALRRRGLTVGWQHAEDDPQVRAYLLRAGAHNRRLPPRDSLLVAADSVRAALVADMNADPAFRARALRLFATLRRAADAYPGDPEVWFALGDAHYHYAFGPGLGTSNREMLAAFRRAIALDTASVFLPAYLHTIELSLTVGEADSARRYIDRYLRQPAADSAAGWKAPDAEALRLVRTLIDAERARAPVPAELLDTTSADAIAKAWVRVSRWPDAGEAGLALARALAGGRRSSYSPSTDSVFTRIRLVQQLAYRGHAAEAYAVLGNRPGRLFAELALLGGVPPDSAASVFGRWLATGSAEARHALAWWAERGDTLSIAAFQGAAAARQQRAASADNAALRAPAAYDELAARAYAALARRDSASALRLFLSLPDSVCLNCFRDRLTSARLLAARGEDRRAMELLRERLYVLLSPTEVLYALERARVARRLGDRQAAADAAVVGGAWARGDPQLRAMVEEALRAGAERGSR